MGDCKKDHKHVMGPEEETGLTAEEMAFFNMAMSLEEPIVEQSKVDKVRKTFLVPTHLVERLDIFCQQYEVKKTDAITVALEEFLAKYR